jgi:hypothetical protein
VSKEKVNAVYMVTNIVGGDGIVNPFTIAEEIRIKQRRMEN